MSETRQRSARNNAIFRSVSVASIAVGCYVMYNLWKKWSKPNITIKTIYLYPVKSCKGFEVQKWRLGKCGLLYDREYMIYSPKTKRRVSQREVNNIALISTKLLFANGNEEVGSVKGIQFSAPEMKDIFVPISNESDHKNKVSEIGIFMDKCDGIDQGNEIAEWLTDYLTKTKPKIGECRLMRVSSEYHRGLSNSERSDEIVITNKDVPQTLINSTSAPYSDAYPLLVVSDASVNEINQRLKSRNLNKIDITRFRPNIVIHSTLNEPFIEDRIGCLAHVCSDQKTLFYLRAPCPRCVMPTINQKTGTMNADHEPTITLRQFRTGKHLGFEEEVQEQVFFGMFGVHNNYESVIQKGDELIPSFK